MRLLTAHPCSGRRGRQGRQAGSSQLCQPFCFSPRRVGCPIPCLSRSFFLPSACKSQPPCKATALIPTKFFLLVSGCRLIPALARRYLWPPGACSVADWAQGAASSGWWVHTSPGLLRVSGSSLAKGSALSLAPQVQVSSVVPITPVNSLHGGEEEEEGMREAGVFSPSCKFCCRVSKLASVGLLPVHSNESEKWLSTHVHSLPSQAVSLGVIWGNVLQSSPCSLGSKRRSSMHCMWAAASCDPLPVQVRFKPDTSMLQQSEILHHYDEVFQVHESFWNT